MVTVEVPVVDARDPPAEHEHEHEHHGSEGRRR
jgi:hypothetical protein